MTVTQECSELATKISNHAKNIRATLENPPTSRDERSSVIVLGSHFQQWARAVREATEREDLELEDYLGSLSDMFSELEDLVSSNWESLGNKALLRHLKQVVNSVLTTTKALEIVNECIDQMPDNDPDTA